jgi:hypothetical protein
VTDDERSTRESEGGREPIGGGDGAPQEVCPCCGLEMSAAALAGLMTQLLPVVAPARPGPAPEVAAD